jgi:hypothetical protein
MYIESGDSAEIWKSICPWMKDRLFQGYEHQEINLSKILFGCYQVLLMFFT